MQVLFHSIFFGMNAQAAVEAGRFQTEHLVSSFDNHAMSPGTLLLDERTAPAVITELQRRKHLVDIRTRYASGAAPVMIRFWPTSLIEAGADPYFRCAVVARYSRTRRVHFSTTSPNACASWRAEYLHRRQFKYEGWLRPSQPDTTPAPGVFQTRDRHLRRIWRVFPQSAAACLQSSPRRDSGTSSSAHSPEHFQRLQSGTDYRKGVPRARRAD